MALLQFSEWLASTPGSIALHESRYLYLAVLTVHVLALCASVGLAAIVDLRLLGLTLVRVPVAEAVSRLMPWMTGGFSVMIGSGALLFYAAPAEKYGNVFFRAKIVLLLLAAMNAWIFHRSVYRSVADWDRDTAPPLAARTAGGAALVLWAAVITLGRMIPYERYWLG